MKEENVVKILFISAILIIAMVITTVFALILEGMKLAIKAYIPEQFQIVIPLLILFILIYVIYKLF